MSAINDSSDSESEYDPTFKPVQLAWQFGCTVTLIQPGIVRKEGAKVRPNEEQAMRLAKKHLPNVSVPGVRGTLYRFKNGVPRYGELDMDLMPGRTLESAWAKLDPVARRRVCDEIWDLASTIRTSIPHPDDLKPGLYRTTLDGSPCRDPLLGSNTDICPRDLDDEAFRNRIYTRYVAHNGLSYRDGEEVHGLLPRSSVSVFAHGDIAPRNIIVDENYRITALLDWESSGWFPDYWEYAQMMKWCGPLQRDWQKWMEMTKPEPWDISGIQKARRFLF